MFNTTGNRYYQRAAAESFKAYPAVRGGPDLFYLTSAAATGIKVPLEEWLFG